jgi:hypothetical protein
MIGTLPRLGRDERQLILTCARRDLEGHLIPEMQAILERPIAWDAVLFFAWFNSVASLLYRHVHGLDGSIQVPREARRRLLEFYHRVGFRNRWYADALREILDVFAEARIPVIVLKGVALVELIYGSLHLRPLIDLNLLVPEGDRRRARDTLIRRGYVPSSSPFQGRFFSQFHLVRRTDFKVDVLLQWHAVNRPRVQGIDMRRFWDEAQPAILVGRTALVPSPVDLLLYLALQPGWHGFVNGPALNVADPAQFIFTEWTNNRLIRFTDIREAILHHRGALDWGVLIERARTSGLEGSAHASFRWVTGLYGDSIPAWVVEALAPPAPRRLRQRLYEALAADPDEPRSRVSANTIVRRWWMSRRRRTHVRLMRLLDILEFIFPGRDDLGVLYRRPFGTTSWVARATHAGKWTAVGLLPWLYRVVVKPRLVSLRGGRRRR